MTRAELLKTASVPPLRWIANEHKRLPPIRRPR